MELRWFLLVALFAAANSGRCKAAAPGTEESGGECYHAGTPTACPDFDVQSGRLPIDVVALYQWVDQGPTDQRGLPRRARIWKLLDRLMTALPKRNLLALAGDFNSVLKPGGAHVGHGVLSTSRHQPEELVRLLQSHDLCVLNSWKSARPQACSTFYHGETKSQIDFIVTRLTTVDPQPRVKPQESLYSLRSLIQCQREKPPQWQTFCDAVGQAIAHLPTPADLTRLNAKVLEVCRDHFPPERRNSNSRALEPHVQGAVAKMWQTYRLWRRALHLLRSVWLRPTRSGRKCIDFGVPGDSLCIPQVESFTPKAKAYTRHTRDGDLVQFCTMRIVLAKTQSGRRLTWHPPPWRAEPRGQRNRLGIRAGFLQPERNLRAEILVKLMSRFSIGSLFGRSCAVAGVRMDGEDTARSVALQSDEHRDPPTLDRATLHLLRTLVKTTLRLDEVLREVAVKWQEAYSNGSEAVGTVQTDDGVRDRLLRDKLLRRLDVLERRCSNPTTLLRFRSTHKLGQETQAEVVPFMLSLSLRGAQAATGLDEASGLERESELRRADLLDAPVRQHDAGEFMQHVLRQAHPPAYFGSWESRLSDPFAVEDHGPLSAPILVDVQAFMWSTLVLTVDNRCGPHLDRWNWIGHSLLIGLSHHDAGGLWLELEGGRHYEEFEGSLRAGHVFSTSASCVLFAGKTNLHATCEWQGGHRVVLVAYCHHVGCGCWAILEPCGDELGWPL
ncbi:dbo [Symbiodinium microadriaticum]|nr:dbo [Symbiodinium microadriaticum]CAE7939358.1 dbo [Symbiodinium sp. KB8]